MVDGGLPACSAKALFNTGLLQSLHFTMPISCFNGSAPNIFMSRSGSQEVGGDGVESTSEGVGGVVGAVSHENGGGSGERLGFSLTAMISRGCLESAVALN